MSFYLPKVLKPAFTMIELILVIIVLGIVSSIGAEIIANVYSGYVLQRAQHRASIKTELAAIQIANRLARAIPGTVLRKDSLNDANPVPITQPGATETILQWVGADIDSFNTITSTANRLPGWSGFCDVTPSTTNSIVTPGSNLALADTIRTNLGLTAASPRVYFPSKTGLVSGQVNTLTLAGTTIGLSAATPTVVEHYKLASSSYALEADGDLKLYYNFDPSINANIPVANFQILLRNVSVFRFRGDGRTIRFKICVDEDIGEDYNITICKEKAVF